ncbi:hypothetical protein [Psychrobacter glacincola]|uniref:hypothetical protein n=1 Tax=Psychrobacter glacincola TaxID=56810 RepID=UPI001918B63F|nr:hypothetical protein [Psychrobacter glacincola]
MHKVQFTSDSISIYLLREYVYQILILTGFMILLLASNSASALAPNPGATCTGIAGASQGSLTNNDYNSLISSLGNFVQVAGNASGSIPLQVKISTEESSSNTTLNALTVTDFDSVRAINVRRTFPNTSAYTDINLDFRNSITTQPIFLTNVALSAFDIDYANSNGNTFDDFVQITGVNEAGTTISGTFQSVTGSNITFSDSLQGLLTRTVSDPNCPAKNLGTQCQGSVQFSQPVSSVKIRYSNTGYLRTSTNQEIDFRVDNYCYVPQYIFSGTVFDDNGGITDTQADANNANITSGTYFNKPNYFNGVFNTPQELGISGSNVRLANCANNSITYPTQSVIRNGASVGEYQISIPKTTLANNTNLCLVESRTGATYPIRTSSESRNVGFSATTYNYPNNNFGRVIAANAALVLQKYQFVNDCNASTLVYASVPMTGDPRTGFSMDPIQNNITPQQCIAYKITATNRANLAISDFIMSDVLQKKGVNNAQVTSIRVAPTDNNGSYATDSVALGLNGTVKTTALMLQKNTKSDFYFNTKYGTTVNP